MIANPTKASAFPTLLWNQKTGESRTFQKAGDVPESGWIDHYPSDEERAAAASAVPAPSPDEPPMTRAEIVAALAQGGITYKKNASTPALYEQLSDAVKFALTEAKIEFNPETPTKDLLALLLKSREGAGAQ